MMGDYAGYISASYAVTFGAILLLVAAIGIRGKHLRTALEKLKQAGVRRRSDKTA